MRSDPFFFPFFDLFCLDRVFLSSIRSSKSACSIGLESGSNSDSIPRKDSRVKKRELCPMKNLFLCLFVHCFSSVVCHAEDCNFVVEGVPSEPYQSLLRNSSNVQWNMELSYFSSSTFIEDEQNTSSDASKFNDYSILMNTSWLSRLFLGRSFLFSSVQWLKSGCDWLN